MGRLGTLTLLELRRRVRDPLAFLTWMAVPFFLVLLLVVVFGPRSAGLPRITVLVVNEDGGALSGFLGSALDSPQLAEFFDARVVEMEEARRLMERGKASALIVIPEGFAKAYLHNEPVTLRVWTNPQETLLPKIAVEAVTFLAESGGLLRAVLHPVAGDLFDGDLETRPSLETVLEATRRIYGILDRPETRKILDLEAIPVVDHHPEGDTAPTRSEVVGWFAPGMVALALLFLCNGQSQDLQEDLLQGRLARAWSFASHPWVSLGAKAAALVLSATGSGLVLVAALALTLGWEPGRPVLVVVQTAATAAAFTGLALMLRSLTRSAEVGGAAASGVMVGLGFLGGCFMPTVFLPPFLQRVADLIPTGWAVQGYLILQGSTWAGPMGSLPLRILLLAVTAAITFAVASWNMGRKAVTP